MKNKRNQAIKETSNLPIIIWSSLIVIGFIVKLLHILSPVFIVIGFAGLTAFSTYNFFVLKNTNKLFTSLIIVCSLFLMILIGGNLFNNEYPLNEIAFILYCIVFTITLLIHLIKNKKNNSN